MHSNCLRILFVLLAALTAATMFTSCRKKCKSCGRNAESEHTSTSSRSPKVGDIIIISSTTSSDSHVISAPPAVAAPVDPAHPKVGDIIIVKPVTPDVKSEPAKMVEIKSVEPKPVVKPEVVKPVETKPVVKPEVVKPVEPKPDVKPEVVKPVEPKPDVKPEVVKPVETKPVVKPEVVKPVETKPVVKTDERKPIRIKAGSPTNWKDKDGNEWLADAGFTEGAMVDLGKVKIEGTTNPDIYTSEHSNMEKFAWPVANGKYAVKLHFVENPEDAKNIGERVFSMDVSGEKINKLDIIKEAGGVNKALVKTVHVMVTTGKIEITFKGEQKEPLINGIEIIPE